MSYKRMILVVCGIIVSGVLIFMENTCASVSYTFPKTFPNEVTLGIRAYEFPVPYEVINIYDLIPVSTSDFKLKHFRNITIFTLN